MSQEAQRAHPDASSITYHKGGAISFNGPDAVTFYAAVSLSASLRLYARCGMIPTRGMTITKMLAMATSYTRTTYKRGEAMKAAEELQAWASELKAALSQITEA